MGGKGDRWFMHGSSCINAEWPFTEPRKTEEEIRCF